MIDYINHLNILGEKRDFSYDVKHKKPVIYGAGKLGILAIETLRESGIEPEFAVDKSQRGEILGIPIRTIEELRESEKKEYLFLVCISTIPYCEIVNELSEKGILNCIQYYTYAYMINPNILSNGWLLNSEHYDIDKACEICGYISHDDLSIAHYITFLYWKRFNKEVIIGDYHIESGCKYFDCDIMPKMSEHETFLDIGCYEGNIINKFIKTVNGSYNKIVGVEPVEEFISTARNSFRGDLGIEFIQCAVSDYEGVSGINNHIGMACHLDESCEEIIQVKMIDTLNIEPTIIKIHAEGAEYGCLKGGLSTIKKCRPILMVLADHNEDGWYAIPKIKDLMSEYELFFRLHDYCGNSAVWYFIPKERCV